MAEKLVECNCENSNRYCYCHKYIALIR